MSRSGSAVSMARSEYGSCPPRVPTPTASQVAIASGANHTVISPRWTSARSYAGQFPTWYFVLYFGCTLDFISRSCTCCRHEGQEVDRGSPRARDPCTNASVIHCAGRLGGDPACHTDQYANNRAEFFHQPTRQRERQMRRFKTAAHLQRFASVLGVVQNLFPGGSALPAGCAAPAVANPGVRRVGWRDFRLLTERDRSVSKWNNALSSST